MIKSHGINYFNNKGDHYKRRYYIIGILLLFIITVYLVNFGPWSSAELAKYNNGYGTFDMKSYNSEIVYNVLDHMEPKGFVIYQKYFIGDYLFAFVFGALQIILLYNAFNWLKQDKMPSHFTGHKLKILRRLIPIVPVARGLCDLIENTSLLHILLTYPIRHESLINFTAIITSLKLALIYTWYFLVILGYIMKAVIRRKEKR